jgi:hypothetical protein
LVERRSVQRKLDDAPGVDDFADGRAGDVNRGRLTCHRDGLCEVAKLQRDIQREVLVRQQNDVRAAPRPETRELGADLIGRGSHRGELISPVRIRHCLAGDSGAGFDCGHGDARYYAASTVSNDAIDLSRLLSKGGTGQKTGE